MIFLVNEVRLGSKNDWILETTKVVGHSLVVEPELYRLTASAFWSSKRPVKLSWGKHVVLLVKVHFAYLRLRNNEVKLSRNED
jgi:hypothetical protein